MILCFNDGTLVQYVKVKVWIKLSEHSCNWWEWEGGDILTRSEACVINADYMQICHRHKRTAVPGLTFLFVTSKHTVHPRGRGPSLISLHLFPTLHRIPHWVWMFSISSHTGCLNHWHKLHFSREDLDLSADLAAGSVVADGLKYCLHPSCHFAAAAGSCDAAFILWSPELQLFAISHPDGCRAQKHHPELDNRKHDSHLWLSLCSAGPPKERSEGHLGCARGTKVSCAKPESIPNIKTLCMWNKAFMGGICSFLLIYGKNWRN